MQGSKSALGPLERKFLKADSASLSSGDALLLVNCPPGSQGSDCLALQTLPPPYFSCIEKPSLAALVCHSWRDCPYDPDLSIGTHTHTQRQRKKTGNIQRLVK